MSALCILICRRDDPASATLTELASFDLPSPDLSRPDARHHPR